ncbi:peptidoglycan D,D-transpeptidase FtsI family protein [Lihuaxuella thermophila]|uniref:Stage V sporulation protein D (Sporulation-specific penicillin-binding protein)/penicillin-binding protein 2B n=1 Tax=Lihuaxuella thermophila TaxID=1173111 RepID=A0A1H8DPJ3_9BACL|nr:penicillin-binding protein 2 [Lihuaxuella thermophila]SEN08437.1 stage V sporulation protein D (sporulation-specific penicillin-binding protein)/penicillin-binding protein 2B [Lihuaxuella thermophila]
MGSLRKSKERSLLIGLVLTLLLSVIILRLFWVQTVNSDEWQAEALKNWVKNEKLKPKRGTIYDRTKEQLAWEEDAYYFVAAPKKVKDKKKTARLLAPILGIDEKVLLQKLQQKKDSVDLRDGSKFKFPSEVYDKVMELRKKKEIEGIYGYQTTKRKYSGNEAAHVLGFLRIDDKPAGGVESTYDKWLRGKEGYIRYIGAQNGMMITDEPEKNRPPVNGKDLVLTLDTRIQHQVELELDEAIKSYQAKGGTAIVADPKTGEILAMVSRPSFDPNNYAATIDDENRQNRAVESQFEPGSTFKIVTLAAAIEEGIFNPDATFQSGSIQVEDRTIRDWNNGRGWGTITYREGVEKSSNVAFVKLGQQLGAGRLVEYINKFGFGDITQKFGKKTGIDLPAEGRGYFFGRSPYPSELASTAFGQGISVTPIQQVAAVSAIANGGIWYKPHVMKEIWEPGLKKRIQTNQPKGRRIIRPETAKQVRELLRGVVKSGTGMQAELLGYGVAGKTGTAQKPDPNGRGYLEGKYVVSFVGFAPYDDPEVVIYVAIDEPSSEYGSVSGGEVAAPVARDILKKTLQIRAVQPSKQMAESIK